MFRGKLKKSLSVLLAVIMMVSAAPLGGFVGSKLPHLSDLFSFRASAADSGACGENLTWTLDDSGALTISGSGDMTDFSWEPAPWDAYRDKITSVTIGSGATSIGDWAFYGCDALTEIAIPDNVETIGSYAFKDCNRLARVTIGSGVTSIGRYAFYGCDALTEIEIPDNVETIGGYAFAYCASLARVTIGSGVTCIDGWAFEYCNALTEIVIPDNVETIRIFAFAYCDSLACVTIGSGVTSISEDAFVYCSSLSSFDVNENNTAYADLDGVLVNSARTTLVLYPYGRAGAYTIPASIQMIGSGAFFDCDALTEIKIPDNVETIGNRAFINCGSLARVTIGSGVTSIGDSAFEWCDALTEIKIPDNVETIGDYAFYSCASLARVTIGSGVTSIGDYAFHDCNALTDALYNGTKADWSRVLIGNSNERLTNAIRFNSGVHTHTYVTWTITKKPTSTTNGLRKTACTICGETRIEIIPALGHDFGECTIILGDVNGDGKINASDARLILRAAARLEKQTDIQKLASDVNLDSKVNASDARIVLRVAAKLQTL